MIDWLIKEIIVKEYKSTGTAYRQRVHTVMRSSFASHYRRMIPQLLEVERISL